MILNSEDGNYYLLTNPHNINAVYEYIVPDFMNINTEYKIISFVKGEVQYNINKYIEYFKLYTHNNFIKFPFDIWLDGNILLDYIIFGNICIGVTKNGDAHVITKHNIGIWGNGTKLDYRFIPLLAPVNENSKVIHERNMYLLTDGILYFWFDYDVITPKIYDFDDPDNIPTVNDIEIYSDSGDKKYIFVFTDNGFYNFSNNDKNHLYNIGEIKKILPDYYSSRKNRCTFFILCNNGKLYKYYDTTKKLVLFDIGIYQMCDIRIRIMFIHNNGNRSYSNRIIANKYKEYVSKINFIDDVIKEKRYYYYNLIFDGNTTYLLFQNDIYEIHENVYRLNKFYVVTENKIYHVENNGIHKIFNHDMKLAHSIYTRKRILTKSARK